MMNKQAQCGAQEREATAYPRWLRLQVHKCNVSLMAARDFVADSHGCRLVFWYMTSLTLLQYMVEFFVIYISGSGSLAMMD